MKWVFLRWTAREEAQAVLTDMQRRLFWKQLATIDALKEQEALNSKIEFTRQFIKSLPPEPTEP